MVDLFLESCLRSYGFPRGTDCDSMKIDPKCHDAMIENNVVKHCLGKKNVILRPYLMAFHARISMARLKDL